MAPASNGTSEQSARCRTITHFNPLSPFQLQQFVDVIAVKQGRNPYLGTVSAGNNTFTAFIPNIDHVQQQTQRNQGLIGMQDQYGFNVFTVR